MNEFKLYKMTAIMLVTLSTNHTAFSMDGGLWGTLSTTVSSVANATAFGTKKMISGRYAVFKEELENGALLSRGITERNHLYDHAVDELIKDRKIPELVDLIGLVNKHNTANPGNKIVLASTTEESARKPLEDYHTEQKQLFVTLITGKMEALIEQARSDHDKSANESRTKNDELVGIKAAIACVKGTDPGDDLLKELVPVLTKKINLIFNPKEDALDDAEKGAAGSKKIAKKAPGTAPAATPSKDAADDDEDDDDSASTSSSPVTTTKKKKKSN